MDSSGSGYNPVVGCCEHGNESSGPIKGKTSPNSWAGIFLRWVLLLAVA